MRVASSIACLLFTVAMTLQYNDPDPFVWMLIYGFIAILSGLAIGKLYFPRITFALMLVYLLAVLSLAPNLLSTTFAALSSIHMQNLQDELVREAWGLLICLIWATVLWRHGLHNVGNE